MYNLVLIKIIQQCILCFHDQQHLVSTGAITTLPTINRLGKVTGQLADMRTCGLVILRTDQLVD